MNPYASMYIGVRASDGHAKTFQVSELIRALHNCGFKVVAPQPTPNNDADQDGA